MINTIETYVALLLLTILLVGSFIVGIRSRRGIVTARDFLFAKNMRWFDFALNTIGTNISVSGGIILTIAYVYKYGWQMGLGIIGAFVLSIITYRSFITKSKEVKDFFNQRQGYSIISFIVKNYKKSKSVRIMQAAAGIAIVISYWSTFSVELLAIEKILGPFWTGGSKYLVLMAGLMCVFYTMLGGYKSVFLTDGIQTGLLGVSIVWFTIVIIGASHPDIGDLFLTRPTDPFEIWISISLFVVLGVAFQITAMDMWVRTQAANTSQTLREPKYGLIWSVLGIVFFIGIILVGILAYVTSSTWGNNPDQILPAFLQYLIDSGMSGSLLISILLVLLFSVALSTADTCLITAAQVVYEDLLPSIMPNISINLTQARYIVGGLGILGILLAFILPGAIEGVFLFAGAQLILIPPLIGAAFRKFNNSAVGATSILVGLLIMLVMILSGNRSIAAFSPIAAVICSSMIFFPLNILFGKTSEGN